MATTVLVIFAAVYLGMILGGLPFLKLDRTGVARDQARCAQRLAQGLVVVHQRLEHPEDFVMLARRAATTN